VSDFLKQFEQDNYQADDDYLAYDPLSTGDGAGDGKGETEDAYADDVDASDFDDYSQVEHDFADEHDHASALTDTAPVPIVAPRQKIASAAHEVKADDKHHKRKLVRYAVIAASILALCVAGVGIFFLANRVVVRDFVGTSVAEARTWGLSNRITIEASEEFNIEYDAGIVMSQDRAEGSAMQRGSILRLTVSKGPDPDERIELPDFSAMTTIEVREWRQEVRALNANINEEYSDEVDQGHFIRLEFTDSAVTEETYTRADGLLIYMSRGAEVFEANILVPDFSEQSKSDVETWAREHGVEPTFREQPSDTVDAGHVVAQSVEAGKRIAKDSDLIITLSAGHFVIVPNFNNLSMEDASAVPGLEVHIRQRYSTSVAFGRVISQSESVGTEVRADSVVVEVTYSLGRPYIDDLRGDSEKVLAEYFHNFSVHGANITYQIVYIDSYEPRGSIVRMSRYAQFLGLNEHITVHVSRGNLVPPEPPPEAPDE